MYREAAGGAKPTQPQTIYFNALPEGSREGLLKCLNGEQKPTPALFEAARVWQWMPLWVISLLLGAGGLWFLMQKGTQLLEVERPLPPGMVSLSLFMGEPQPEFDPMFQGVQPEHFVWYYIACLLMIVIGAFQTIYALTLRSSLPYKPGRYVFPGFVLDARSAKIKVIPVHSFEDASAVGRRVLLRFAGLAESFSVENAFAAEEKAQEVRLAQRSNSEEVLFPEIISQDALFDVARRAPSRPQSGPVARTITPMLRLLLVGVGLASFPVGYALWVQRNTQEDQRLLEHAKGIDSVQAYEWYIALGGTRPEAQERLEEAHYKKAAGDVGRLVQLLEKNPSSKMREKIDEELYQLARESDEPGDYEAYLKVGSRHHNEAEAQLLAAEFREAARSRSLLQLRELLQSDSPFAKDASKLYDNLLFYELEKFHKEYLSLDPKFSSLVEKLFTSFKGSKIERINILILHPDINEDKELFEYFKNNPDIEELGDTFEQDNSNYRLRDFMYDVSSSLRELFNEKMYFVSTGTELDKDNSPVLTIKYSVKPSRIHVEGEQKYAILNFDFIVTFAIPGDPNIFAFSYQVKPPADFEFESTKVYSETISRAFNELYFKIEEKMFRRTEQEEQPWLYNAFASEKSAYLVGDGTILGTSSGRLWNELAASELEFYGVWEQNNTVYAVGQNGTTLYSSDGKSFFADIFEPETETTLHSIHASPDGTLWAVGSEGVVLTSTGKKLENNNLWQKQIIDSNYFLSDVWVVNKDSVYIAAIDGLIFYTKNGGKTWDRIKLNTVSDFNSIVVLEEEKIFAVGDNGLIAVCQNVNQCTSVSYGRSNLYSIVSYKGSLYIAGENQVILKSADQGKTWREEFFGEGKLYALFEYQSTLYAAGEMGLMKRLDDGRWTSQEIQ